MFILIPPVVLALAITFSSAYLVWTAPTTAFTVLAVIVLVLGTTISAVNYDRMSPMGFVYTENPYLLSLLDGQPSYTQREIKRMLRKRCPSFAAISRRRASKTARHLMVILEERGKQIIKPAALRRKARYARR